MGPVFSKIRSTRLYCPSLTAVKMHEILVNIHMHTRYSDGWGGHGAIVQAALQTGIDAVIVTDHNVLVNGPDGYHRDGPRRTLVIVGEEVHDVSRQPQKNHLLVVGAGREMAGFADDPQTLIDAVQASGGLSFLAHPFDQANKTFAEPDITWEAWDVSGYTGVELWNGLSEFKSLLKSRLHAAFYALNPDRVPHGPPPEMLARWDELLGTGRRVVAIAGSDAHMLPGKMGPLRRTIFPYETHFRSLNNHVLLAEPLTLDDETDTAMILQALRNGHTFLANELPAPARGFRFTAETRRGEYGMGDEAPLDQGITLQVRLPLVAECRLLHNGQVVRQWHDRQAMVANVNQPGVYRVEAILPYRGRRRGWIYSNPIYVS